MVATSALLLVLLADAVASLLIPSPNSRDLLSDTPEVVGSVLATGSQSNCISALITDGSASHTTIIKMGDVGAAWGVGMFEVAADSEDTNKTQAQLSFVIKEARWLRQVSWCVTVVVVSDDPAFLTAFAEWSIKGRLLVWSTRLLVVTRLPGEDLGALLASHWAFSMMNTMAINVDASAQTQGCSVFVYLPYSPVGAQVVQLASWTPDRGLHFLHPLTLFPEKYLDFHGATINVTVLTYEPYWKTTEAGNTTRYSGTDYNQLEALGQALKFKFRVLPSRDWLHVTGQTQVRKSFLTPMMYAVLPNRLERWDYTFVYDQTNFHFAMATPVLTPSWLSFYYPLSGEVWIAVLASTFFVCFALVKITRTKIWISRHGRLTIGSAVMEAVGILLGQGLYGRLSTSHSNHILVGIWLLFGVVVGTAYRGSLIASLTLPRLPPRPETVEELVKAVDR